MSPRKIDIFYELDELIPEGYTFDEALEYMKGFRKGNPFHGVWYHPVNDEFYSDDDEALNIVADYFDGTYGTACVTWFYNPEDDRRNNEVDEFTGLYGLSIEM